MAERLTFTAYWNLVLARLYEKEQNGERPRANVAELMADLAGIVPNDWAWEAAMHLVKSGLARDLLSFGNPEVELNAQGRLRAEAGAGIIGDYQRSPQIVLVHGDGNQVAVGHNQTVTQIIQGDLSKEEVGELLNQAEAVIEADGTLTDGDREGALADVAAMRAQLAKENPNRAALRALAAGLPALASLAEIAEKIRQVVS
jgi:hypothetical protein